MLFSRSIQLPPSSSSRDIAAGLCYTSVGKKNKAPERKAIITYRGKKLVVDRLLKCVSIRDKKELCITHKLKTICHLDEAQVSDVQDGNAALNALTPTIDPHVIM